MCEKSKLCKTIAFNRITSQFHFHWSLNSCREACVIQKSIHFSSTKVFGGKMSCNWTYWQMCVSWVTDQWLGQALERHRVVPAWPYHCIAAWSFLVGIAALIRAVIKSTNQMKRRCQKILCHPPNDQPALPAILYLSDQLNHFSNLRNFPHRSPQQETGKATRARKQIILSAFLTK